MGIINFLVYLAIMMAIYGILSLSLNLQYGFTGLANFGQVGFFCLGAYTSTTIVLVFKLPFILGLLGGMLASTLFGYIIAIPTADLKEDYWAIVTLAAAEIIRIFFLNESWVVGGGPYVGGAFGVGGIPQPLRSLFSAYTYPFFYLGIALLCLLVAYLVINSVTRSPFGRVIKSIREGDNLAQAMGKDIRKFRIKVMALGGAFGGLAGCLWAHYHGFISPEQFLPLETFLVWAMVIVGGKGNNKGAILGAVIIMAFYNSTRFLKDYIPIEEVTLASLRMVVIGVLIVAAMLFMKEGLIKEKKTIY
ncbi:MAG: branched-chain amino acid ABC transporter permease [Deltaproteobacteria bacterium]|nr:branched-chain amino acid ABC transporter permease [Deltaproteobacteria bacterium]MBW1935166.1 branched-chain amino acid ABC transporter permease [Deltaproteobacteria bacterium]MBW1977394.1 branched-chain amino acid ABC transporter permease [Deltaproteobacteria bacterium]MBW2044048.1 branched-chain amino acid ABC transporter permease [Deltaproteobacteria bacterium]MBW2300390.1 branched-chain amino acid ABC transporter permease [Deltaproteobacteria bacterium]